MNCTPSAASLGIMARSAISVVGRGCPIAIALPWLKATCAACSAALRYRRRPRGCRGRRRAAPPGYPPGAQPDARPSRRSSSLDAEVVLAPNAPLTDVVHHARALGRPAAFVIVHPLRKGDVGEIARDQRRDAPRRSSRPSPRPGPANIPLIGSIGRCSITPLPAAHPRAESPPVRRDRHHPRA